MIEFLFEFFLNINKDSNNELIFKILGMMLQATNTRIQWMSKIIVKKGIINRFMADKHKILYFTPIYLSFGRKEEKHFLSQRLIKAFYFNHVLGAMHSFAVFVSIIIIIITMLSSATGTLTEYWFSSVAQSTIKSNHQFFSE